jgi:purine-binding chemotaxis protein CheW
VVDTETVPGRSGPPRPAAAPPVKLVCFALHGQEYGAPITGVKETLAVRPITRVFLTPPWLAGIMNLRGDVVAVLDLARLLELPAITVSDDSRIVVLRHQGRRAGILVDHMAELRTVDAAAIAPAPATLPAEAAELLRGLVAVDGGVVRVLDVAAVFESERVHAFQRGGS